MKIIFKDTFVNRLESQLDYISLDSPKRARKFKNELFIRIKEIPTNPSSTKDLEMMTACAILGKGKQNAQIKNPATSPTTAPWWVSRFQYIPPMTDGASCATAVNEISPTDTKS